MNLIPSQIIPGTIEFYLFRISRKSQAIYLSLALMVVIIISLLPFIYVDVSVSAPGIITTQFEQQTLYAPSQGKITFSRIKANEKVTRGDTLLILDSNVLSAHLGSLEIQNEENNQSIHDLLLLVNMDSLQTITGIPRLITSKYKTEFESNGASLSGGQKQRIAIARALYRDPEILILDEATSSLDTVAEGYVHKTISLLREQKKSIIIIAHRLSTIMHVDKVVVLDQGKVVQEGTVNELSEMDGKFRDMFVKDYFSIQAT
jgi:ABC-type bacteriocin/lantibiotic exporter with double-glycine peptidase domain